MTSEEQLDNKWDYRDRFDLPEGWIRDPNALKGIWYHKRMDDAVELLDKERKRVLDFGCGDGYFTKLLTDRGFSAVGVDYNDRAIGFAKTLVPDAKFIYDDIRTMKPLPEKFDHVVSISVIEHLAIKHQVPVLKNAATMLKDDGRLTILLPSKHVPLHKYHYCHYSTRDISELLDQSGFKPISFHFHNVYDPWVNIIYNPKVFLLLNNPVYDLRGVRALLRLFHNKWLSKARSNQRYQLITAIAQKK